jgi:hypothetical protein
MPFGGRLSLDVPAVSEHNCKVHAQGRCNSSVDHAFPNTVSLATKVWQADIKASIKACTRIKRIIRATNVDDVISHPSNTAEDSGERLV